MANKGNTRTQSFGNMQSEPNRKDDVNANRGRETQNLGRSGSKTNKGGNNVDNDEVEHDRESRSRSSRSRSSRSRKRSRSPFANDMRQAPDVCRDFLRNDCSRGQDCRYFHPDGEKTDRPSRADRDRDPDRDRDQDRDIADKEPFKKKSWFTVCLDYQNGKCSRDDCRYFHVSDDDEDLFRETGEVSNHILKQAVCNVHLDIPSERMRPTCKHYLNGSCRLKNCRYRHVSREEYEDEIYKYLQDALLDIIGPPKGSLGRNVLPQHRMSAKPGLLGPSPFHSQDNRNMDDNYGKPGALLNDFRPEIFDRREDGSRQRMDTRGNSYMRSENFVPSREVDLNDVDSLRRECIRLQDCMYDGIREKDDIITELEMKLDDYKRSFLESGGYDDHNIMAKLNRELQFEIDNLRKENSDLKNNGGRDDKDFEQLRKEARIKIAELEDDNQILLEKNDKMDTQVNFFKNEIQAWKNYEIFVKDQITNLQSQFFIAERELSHSWGGGPPPLASQREAWSHVKSIVSLVANSNPQNIANQNQNNPSGHMKMKMESDGKPTSPLGNIQPGSSPGPKMGPTNAQSNAQNNRSNAPNGIRFNAPNTIRPGVPNAVRPIAPLIRPGNVRPGAPGALRPAAPGGVRPVLAGTVRPGAPGIRPVAPGTVRPNAPGTVRPGAPGIRPVAPGGIRQLAPGNIRAAAPGILRTNAPNTIRQSTPGNGKSPTPSNLMPNTSNNLRPTAPGAVRLNQPGTARPISSNNIRPTQPNSIRPTSLTSNRPVIKTGSPSTSVEPTSYDNLKHAEGYNTAGYYSSGSANYQADASGNYSGYTPETAGNYSATAQTNFSAETGNYSSTTPANYPANASGTYTADSSTYSTGTAVTYPASSTGGYPAGAPAAYGTGASGTYPTDASGNYSAGASGNYSSGASGSYSADAAAPYSNNGSYSTGASGTYPPVDSSGTYPTDGSYPPTDASSNYASTGSYATGMYGMYGSYNESYTSYNADNKKNAEFISQMYNQPPPPPPSQSSPASKEETITGQYWRTGF